MPSLVFQPLLEVFLLVEQPRQRLSHWTQALAPLDRAGVPPVATVDAYYDPTSNHAVFGLRYDELVLGPDRLGFLVELAVLAEIGMIQPAELSEGERGRLVAERLSRCTVHVGDQRTIVGALVELVRRVREHGPSQRTTASSPALEMPMPVVAAKGTRDFSPAAGFPRATRELAHGSVRRPKHEFGLVEDTEVSGAAAVPEPLQGQDQGQEKTAPVTLHARRLAAALSPPRPEHARPSQNVVSRGGVHRATTVTMPPEEAQRMIEAAGPRTVETPTQPYLPIVPVVGAPSDPGTIYARYLRSGRWMPIRIGTLSLKGATLMAGALPRIDDRVEVGLAYANYRVLVPAAVGKISTMQEAATSGAATFSVRFELDEASRRELTALLTAARAAKVTLKPPPMRSTRRYPVEWPVCLGTARGAVRADALDISAGGMFVRPLHALTLDANVTFSAVLDDGLAPVSGLAQVVRTIRDAEARALGLSPGYGLQIVEMAGEDRERWAAFLTRIEQRAGKRVLIGAAPARLAELQSELIAAGYAVTGGSEPGALAQLASAEAHPVDGALIDASWLTATSSSRVESLFSVRNVPCVTVQGGAQRARIAVDRLLSVM